MRGLCVVSESRTRLHVIVISSLAHFMGRQDGKIMGYCDIENLNFIPPLVKLVKVPTV